MPTVTLERAAEHVTLLTLDRPERLNAMSLGLVADLHDALDDVAGDPDCRVVVVTGRGRGFCSGLDLKELGDLPAPGTHRFAPVGTTAQEFIAALPVHLRATPQIVLAAVSGAAYGGGLSLALGCDLRIASVSATFCSAYIRTGLSGTDIGVSYLLPRLIGAARAFDLILTGRTVDAVEAERIGLVSRVVPDDELLDAALETATLVAGYSRTGLLLTKEVMWQNVDAPSLQAAISIENRNQLLASRTGEIMAFQERFAGR